MPSLIITSRDESSLPTANSRCSKLESRPDGPTRFVCTWLLRGIRWLEMLSTAHREKWARGPNDLPSAPLSVNQPKAAPKPVAPPAPPPEDAPSSGSSTAGSDSVANAADERRSDLVDQGGTTIRVPVNEVSVVFTVTD